MSENSQVSVEIARFSSMTSSIHKALECPICLEVVQAPVRMCSGGHITCSACADQLPKCSICEQIFIAEKPTFLNGLLEGLPRCCRYSDNGCKNVCVTGDEHEDFCAFRGITCRQEGCGEKVSLSQIETHYEENHPDRYLVRKIDQTLTWDYFKPNDFESDNSPVFLNGHFFYISPSNDNAGKNLKYTFEAFISGVPKCNYFVTIAFVNTGEFLCKRTIEAILMKGDRDNRGFELIAESENPED